MDQDKLQSAAAVNADLARKWIDQIAFYLGDVNLPRDKFLLTVYRANGDAAPLASLVQFARMKAIGASNVDLVAEVLRSANHPLLQLTDDGTAVRRRTPLPEAASPTPAAKEATAEPVAAPWETKKRKQRVRAPKHHKRLAQVLDYVLVLDFEAITYFGHPEEWREITEFPVVVLDLKTKAEVARFHQYVLPTVTPANQVQGYIAKKYTPWGLGAAFEGAKTITGVLEDFDKFLVEHKLIDVATKEKLCKWTFVTCGNWDLKTMLPLQSVISKFTIPSYMTEWMNIKDVYCAFYNHKITGMMAMLTALLIEHEGHHHSGIDDVLNIAAIARAMVDDGCRLQRTATKRGDELHQGEPFLDPLA